MEEVNYYNMAEDDYMFLKYNYEHKIVRNAMTSLSQNICEKYLKHIIAEYYENDATEVLKAHSLRKILNFIKVNIKNFKCDRTVILGADGYYYNTRYPGDDSFFADKDDIEMCWLAVCETKRAVDCYLEENKKNSIHLKTIEGFN